MSANMKVPSLSITLESSCWPVAKICTINMLITTCDHTNHFFAIPISIEKSGLKKKMRGNGFLKSVGWELKMSQREKEIKVINAGGNWKISTVGVCYFVIDVRKLKFCVWNQSLTAIHVFASPLRCSLYIIIFAIAHTPLLNWQHSHAFYQLCPF